MNIYIYTRTRISVYAHAYLRAFTHLNLRIQTHESVTPILSTMPLAMITRTL